jgi:hypothetical protein
MEDAIVKSVFEDSFIERKKTADGSLVPLPYEIVIIDN